MKTRCWFAIAVAFNAMLVATLAFGQGKDIRVAFNALLFATLALGQGKDIRVAFIYDKTGPLEAYVKQTQTGLMVGIALHATAMANQQRVFILFSP